MHAYGLEIINDIAARLDLEVDASYTEKDYTLKKKKARELCDQGLIKSSDGTFTV
ncbi:MAG TPA: hypothetical protein VFD05_02005 [Bacilli bacterium]|nr:hypothetical protein [Bacilli bacterium]